MTERKPLAPCPFCGEHAETYFIPERHSYQIECSDSMGCTARVTRDSELGAIEAWNCRASTPVSHPDPAGMEPVAYRRQDQHGGFECEDGITSFAHDPTAEPLYTAAQVQAMGRVPAGWQAVPVEPTKEMKVAAVKFANGSAVYKAVATAVLEIEEGIYGEAYEAMLAAAPSGTAREPLTDSQIADIYFEALGSQHLREQDRKMVTRFARAVEAAHGIRP